MKHPAGSPRKLPTAEGPPLLGRCSGSSIGRNKQTACRWLVCAAAALAVAIACAPGLPGAQPLGAGALAEPEPEPKDLFFPRDAGADPTRSHAPDTDAHDEGERPDAASSDADHAEDAERDADADDAIPPDAGDASADTDSVDFAGEYRGEDVSVIRIDGFAKRTERDPNARTKVERLAPDRIEITLINSANGDPLCTVSAQVEGHKANVDAGQSCFDEEGEVRGSIADGTAQIAGDHLTVDFDVELEVSLGSETRSGSLDYHFEGVRK